MGIYFIGILIVILIGWFLHDFFNIKFYNSLTSKKLDFRGFYFLPVVMYMDFKINEIRGTYIGWLCFLIFVPIKKIEKKAV